MSFKSGLFRRRQSRAGLILTNPDFGLELLRPVSGKMAGRRHICLQPGVGLSGDIIGNTQLLAAIGAKFIFTDFCPGQEWVSDGQFLHPVGGVALVTQLAATLANPIFTLTLAAATGTFTGYTSQIPANLCIPGTTIVHIEGLVRHTTAAATANLNLRFGNAGTSSDTSAVSMNEAATTNQDTRFDAVCQIAANGVDYNTSNTASNQGHTTSGMNDRIASIVLTSPLKVSMDISAGTSGDVWKATMLRVEIWQ